MPLFYNVAGESLEWGVSRLLFLAYIYLSLHPDCDVPTFHTLVFIQTNQSITFVDIINFYFYSRRFNVMWVVNK